MNRLLAINTLIEWVPVEGDATQRLERVLWMDNAGEQVVVVSVSDADSLPFPVWKRGSELEAAIAGGQAFRRMVDPFAQLAMPDPAFLHKHKDRMERAWELIRDLVAVEPGIYLEEQRGPLVRKAAERSKVDPKEVYRKLKRFWRGGKIKHALLPAYKNCGGPGKERLITESRLGQPKRGRPRKILQLDPEYVGVNVDEELHRIFRISIDLYYNTKEGNPLRRAYDLMIDKHFNLGYRNEGGVSVPVLPPASQLPSFPQFRYWHLKERDLAHSIVSRRGEKRYFLKSRPILGNSTQMAFGPGSIFQIDATIGDVYLVSTLNRNWIIGRPVIYFVVDVFSRMVAGIYVGLEGPSWVGAMMALANATTDKVSFCSEYDVEIDSEAWPCRYLPEMILGDRGELLGLDSDSLADSLDIRVANCPPYRADWKGIVEQMFRRANLKSIHWLPGAVRKRERGDPDHRLDATLDLRQFTKIIILTVIKYNLHHRVEDYPLDRDMIADDVPTIPVNLWEWGIGNRGGHLREKSPETIRLNLMPTGSATVTPKGIRFQGVHYTTARALREQWYVRARSEGTWTVPVSYDPRNMEVIYLRAGDGSSFDPCTLLPDEERFNGVMLEEVLDFFALNKLKSQLHEGRRLQSDAALRAQVAAIKAEAAKMKEESGPQKQSNNQRLKGIRDNRAEEKKHNRQGEAFDLRAERHCGTSGTLLPLAKGETSAKASSSAKRKDFLDILKGDGEEEQP